MRIKPIFSTGDGEFGAACSLTTPAFPVISLTDTYCGITLSSLEQYIYCTPVIGATYYEWYFGHNYNALSTIITTTSPNIKASTFYSSLPLDIYMVRVRAKSNTQTGDFGDICEITMPSILKSGTEYNETEEILSAEYQFNSSDENIVTTSVNNEVASLFPNPAINEINIEVGNTENNYTAYIVDVKGSQVSKVQAF
ncbi:MAG: hypothetical protein IPO21_17610 [Bacteroidales bacterium]|nr:hypothetical protein [Bacteroidales bacterium]